MNKGRSVTSFPHCQIVGAVTFFPFTCADEGGALQSQFQRPLLFSLFFFLFEEGSVISGGTNGAEYALSSLLFFHFLLPPEFTGGVASSGLVISSPFLSF